MSLSQKNMIHVLSLNVKKKKFHLIKLVEENSLIFPVDFIPAVSHIYDSGKYILVFCEKTVAER